MENFPRVTYLILVFIQILHIQAPKLNLFIFVCYSIYQTSMKNKILSLLFAVTAIALFSCRGHRICCAPIPPNPGGLFIFIKQKGQPYPDSLMKGVKMYYFENGKKITNPNDAASRPSNMMYGDTVLLQRVYGNNDSIVNYIAPGVFSSFYVIQAVASSNVHDFYLQFPDGSIDSLNIEIEKYSEKEMEQAPCQCLNQITHITINGKPMLTDTAEYSLYGGGVDNNTYLIEK